MELLLIVILLVLALISYQLNTLIKLSVESNKIGNIGTSCMSDIEKSVNDSVYACEARLSTIENQLSLIENNTSINISSTENYRD